MVKITYFYIALLLYTFVCFGQTEQFRLFSEWSDSYSLYPIKINRDKNGDMYYLMEKKEYKSWYFSPVGIKVVKVNEDLDSLWRYLSGMSAHDVIPVPGDGCVLVGSAWNLYSRAYMEKLNATGRREWKKEIDFGSYQRSFLHTGIIESDSMLVLGGNVEGVLVVIRTTMDNSATINAQLDSAISCSYVHKIYPKDSGGYYILYKGGTDSTGEDIMLASLTSDLNLKWTRTLPGNRNDIYHGSLQKENGNLVIWGATESTIPFGADYHDPYIFETSLDSAENNIAWYKRDELWGASVSGAFQHENQWVLYVNNSKGTRIEKILLSGESEIDKSQHLFPETNTTQVKGAFRVDPNRVIVFGQKKVKENKYSTWIAYTGNSGDLPQEISSSDSSNVIRPIMSSPHINLGKGTEYFSLSGRRILRNTKRLGKLPSSVVVQENRKKIHLSK